MENSKKLQVNCSPGTLRQISDDPEYADKFSQHFLQEVDEDFDEIVFTPIVDILEAPVELHDIDTNIPTGSIWPDAAAKLLLTNFKELSGKVGKSNNLRNKTRLWRTISENIAKEGYTFSPSQVESKFRGLEKQYKKIKLKNSQIGRNRVNCMYQDELDEILGIKRGVNTEYTLNSESKNIATSPSSAEISQEALDDVPTTSARAREPEKEKLLKKLEEISQRKQERHNKIIELLEKKENNRKIKEKDKEEREKRREAMANRIITLLKKVADKISK